MATPAVPFAQLAAACEPDGLSQENSRRIAAELAKTFSVRDDEVAILRLEGRRLIFVYPHKLQEVGSIPLNNSAAVAARTANSRRAEAINNFAQARHATVFEAVERAGKSPEAKQGVIQKLMSCPVVGAAGVVGVIQVSRKGPSKRSAGPDFSPSDLQQLSAAAAALAKCFR